MKARFPKIEAQATLYVVFACAVAGITGGVVSTKDFQEAFFPSALGRTDSSYYCHYNNEILQLFASIMRAFLLPLHRATRQYFTGAVASIPGAFLSKLYGRTMTMTIAGLSFLIGSGILAGAVRRPMLVLGRCFWGIGVGLADQAVTVYSAEMAPPHLRGSLTMLFQLCTVSGILFAQATNVGTEYLWPWGWRLSLGIAAGPGLLLLLGGAFLPETPNSLIERGYLQRGRAVLEEIRGTSEVDAEYGTIVQAQQQERARGQSAFRTLFSHDLRPHLSVSIACPFFQQWSGVNGIVFWSPFIFEGVSGAFSGERGALLASLVVGGVQVIGTVLGIAIVDHVNRRHILIAGSLLTFVAEVTLAIIFAARVTPETEQIGGTAAVSSIVLICTFIFAFGFGWGPLGWVIPSEIQPLATRSAGQGITVFVQLLSGAIVGQTFLHMLCRMRWGTYVLFGGLQLLAAIWVFALLPETRGIPIEQVSEVFRDHWYWKRYYVDQKEPEEPHNARRYLATQSRPHSS